jgi:hypothetical protein
MNESMTSTRCINLNFNKYINQVKEFCKWYII